MQAEKLKVLNVTFEKGVRFLTEHFLVPDETARKPVLFHDIRVGVYLYERGYSAKVVLAGLLHDTLEWSSATEDMVRDEFGDEVFRLVRACTKDDSIKDPVKKIDELIRRCARAGKAALIVKTADILDSLKWYESQNNKAELQYCACNIEAILRHKPAEMNDPIFDELNTRNEIPHEI